MSRPHQAGRAEVPVTSLGKNRSQHVGLSLSESLGESLLHGNLTSEAAAGHDFKGVGDLPPIPSVPLACKWLCPMCQRCPGHNTPHSVPGTPPTAQGRPGRHTTGEAGPPQGAATPGVGGGAQEAAGQVSKEGPGRGRGWRRGGWPPRGQGHVLQPDWKEAAVEGGLE